MSKYAINPGTYTYTCSRNPEWVITDKITWHKPKNYRPNKSQNKIWFSESIGGREFYVVRTVKGMDLRKPEHKAINDDDGWDD